MILEHNIRYHIFELYQDNNIAWDIYDPELSGDLIAGLVAAFWAVVDDMIYSGYIFSEEKIRIVDSMNNSVTLLFGDIEIYLRLLKNYIILNDYSLDNITKELAYSVIDVNDYGWWILIPHANLYTLFSFSSTDFMYGFIKGCELFNRDFRDYTLGTPFKYRQDTIVNYGISGFDMIPFVSEEKIPAIPEAFTSERNESDTYITDYE